MQESRTTAVVRDQRPRNGIIIDRFPQSHHAETLPLPAPRTEVNQSQNVMLIPSESPRLYDKTVLRVQPSIDKSAFQQRMH